MGVGLWLISVLMSLKQASGVLNAWTVVLPEVILGLHGSCVLVPCHFTIPEQRTQDLLNCSNRNAWWVRFLGGPAVAPSQGKIIGDVRSYNCTTVFFGLLEQNLHLFYFRLDCSKYTFTEVAQISLQRAPPPPQLDSVHPLLEGELVELQCSVPVPCPALPPSITWLPQDDVFGQHTRLQQDEDQLWTLTSTLTLMASANHHNRSITCSASYPLLDGSILEPSTSTRVLSVLYAPRWTEATLLRSGPEGQTLALICSSDANPPVSIYSWYSVSSAGQLIWQGQGEVMVLTVTQFHSEVILCEAENTIGSQRSRPVPLLASATTGISVPAQILFVLCGVLFLLYILMVAVNVHKYQRLSRRLKQIEGQKENIYANLRRDTDVSEYDQIQLTPSHPAPQQSQKKPEVAASTSNVPYYVIPLPT